MPKQVDWTSLAEVPLAEVPTAFHPDAADGVKIRAEDVWNAAEPCQTGKICVFGERAPCTR